MPTYNIDKIRSDFPILQETANGKPLVYLDNAATTQKPQVVIDAVSNYYEHTNSNIHRGVHFLSQRATDQYEDARETVRSFINANSTREIIFTRGTTEAINLVKSTFGRQNIGEGDEILVTAMEHHSNIVPWQMLCEETGATLRVIPINDDGEVLLDEFDALLSEKTKLVSCVYVSNALGTVNPVRKIVKRAHAAGALTLVDGAQSSSHVSLDMQELDCDFYTISGHKVCGPTGIGILYGKEKHLEAMPPFHGGGDMIKSVTWEKTLYNDLPFKFEAGTPNIAGAIGLGAALKYLTEIGIENIAAHEQKVLSYATEKLKQIDGVRLIGTAKEKASVLSFVMGDAHPHDIGTILDSEGVAIRAGHHCTQPLMKRFGIAATARASFSLYNTESEADALVAAVEKVNSIFS